MDYVDKKSILNEHKKLTFFAHLRAGIIERAFLKDTKDSSLNNFIKSILSLFQYQLSEKTVVEDDITGTCVVRYISKSSTKFMKIKTDCRNDLQYRERSTKALGCEARITRVNIIETSADGFLDSIHSSDHHKFSVNAYKNVGFKTGSLFFLKLDTVKDCETVKAESFDDAVKTLEGYKETNLLPELSDENLESANVSHTLRFESMIN